jgi:hypothetical protein
MRSLLETLTWALCHEGHSSKATGYEHKMSNAKDREQRYHFSSSEKFACMRGGWNCAAIAMGTKVSISVSLTHTCHHCPLPALSLSRVRQRTLCLHTPGAMTVQSSAS